ncbi:MAG: hypothetical protein LBI60_06200 [Bacteroidales bacterium]|jgi:hypothetical protein|nr:hypothetical protein [Bacteroidales bacterium]
MEKYIVLKEFADKTNISKRYKPGDELPVKFGKERLEKIVSLGLAKVEDSESGNGKRDDNDNHSAGNSDIDLSEKVADILPKIKEFANSGELTQYLEAEKIAEKPRQTVIKAIEERLAKIGYPESGKTE